MDLEAGGLLQEERDPVEVSERIVTRYRELWAELTERRAHRRRGERWRVDDRIRRLNKLGFDVDELTIIDRHRRHHDPASSPRSWTPATTRDGCCA